MKGRSDRPPVQRNRKSAHIGAVPVVSDHRRWLVFVCSTIVWATVLSFVASGCAVRLAPNYDPAIVEGLTSANEQTLILFASVSAGVMSGTFSNRETTYNGLIGKFDALRIQAGARRTPRSPITGIFSAGTGSDKAASEADALAPTPQALATIVSTLTTMRNEDRASGLTPFIVTGFKREFEISIDQALVYEKALER